MKKLIALLLPLTLLPASALAFDSEELHRLPNTTAFEHPGSADTVIRMMNQPYMGEMDDGSLAVFIDFIEKVDLDLTLLRVMTSISVYEPIQADTLIFTVGKKTYSFTAECDQYEYDGIYMEDYTFCLTGESLAFLKALAQQKKDDPIPVTFTYEGTDMATGRVVLPGDDAASLYDAYTDLGGKKQDLSGLEEKWPCKIGKK